MLIRIFHKFSLAASILLLAVLLIATTIACAKWGIETGLTLGFLAFLVLGGFDAAWYLATRNMQQRIDEKTNETEIKKSYSGTENNPTIR